MAVRLRFLLPILASFGFGLACSEQPAGSLGAYRAPPEPPRPGCRSSDVLAIPVGNNAGYASLDAALDSGRIAADWEIDVNQAFGNRSLDVSGSCCDGLLCVEAGVAVVPGLATTGPSAVLQISLVTGLEAVEIPEAGRTMIVTVDASGSLLGLQRIGLVKEALHVLIDGLEDDAIFGLVAFDARPRVLVAAGPMSDVRALAHEEVDALAAGGGTNLSLGLQAAFMEAQRVFDGGRDHRVLLVTDGNDPRGQVDAGELSNQLEAFHDRGIQLTVFGVGSENEQDWLRPLTERADGRFLEDDGAENLNGLVTDELGRRYVPIATELELHVRPPDGARFGRNAGWAPVIRPDGIMRAELSGILMSPERDMITLGQGLEGGPALVADLMPVVSDRPGEADIVLQFNPAGGGARRIVRAQIALPEDWPNVAAPGHTPKPAAQEALLARHIGNGIQEAIDLWTQGDRDGAIRSLILLEAVIADFPGGDADVDVASDLSRVGQLRRKMEGLASSRPQVDVPADPWPGE